MPPKRTYPLISIIIPVYNVSAYIARCLRSCINQTLCDIEILVVDDCGSDDSIKIASDFAANDNRIKIIHNPHNLGTFGARMVGIKHARGAYICFIDADDYVQPNLCESLSYAITTYKNPDIIHFGMRYKGSKKARIAANIMHKIRYVLPVQQSKKPLYNEAIMRNFFAKSQFPKFTLCDKCFKSQLLQESYPFLAPYMPLKLTMAEDMLHFFVIATLAKSLVSVKNRCYIYALNAHSITQNPAKSGKKIADMCHIIEILHTLSPKLRDYNQLNIIPILCSNLAALILLESRFITDTKHIHIERNEGGGYTYPSRCYRFYQVHRIYQHISTHYRAAYATHIARIYRAAAEYTAFTIHPLTIYFMLCAIAHIVESHSHIYAFIRVYPKLWSHKTLNFYRFFALIFISYIFYNTLLRRSNDVA